MVVSEKNIHENEDKFKDFLTLHMFPIVTEMNDKSLEKVLSDNQRKGIFLFRSEDNKENAQKYDEAFKKVATEFRSKDLLFIQSDIKGALGKQIAETFGIQENNLPLMQAVEMQDETLMYRHNGELTEEEIKKFIENWKSGKATRYYTSEPIPTENPGPIYKVVGKTFKQEVIDSPQYVILKFYAPFCDYSKTLEPIYKKMAEIFKDNKNIKFCEIDATKNDLEGYKQEGYPTLKFYPANDKSNPFVYDGDFTEEAIHKFISEKTNPEKKDSENTPTPIENPGESPNINIDDLLDPTEDTIKKEPEKHESENKETDKKEDENKEVENKEPLKDDL